eukprot:scaffold7377_cov257-Pinguiococcus_pyrenoidosus.AAC.10
MTVRRKRRQDKRNGQKEPTEARDGGGSPLLAGAGTEDEDLARNRFEDSSSNATGNLLGVDAEHRARSDARGHANGHVSGVAPPETRGKERLFQPSIHANDRLPRRPTPWFEQGAEASLRPRSRSQPRPQGKLPPLPVQNLLASAYLLAVGGWRYAPGAEWPWPRCVEMYAFDWPPMSAKSHASFVVMAPFASMDSDADLPCGRAAGLLFGSSTFCVVARSFLWTFFGFHTTGRGTHASLRSTEASIPGGCRRAQLPQTPGASLGLRWPSSGVPSFVPCRRGAGELRRAGASSGIFVSHLAQSGIEELSGLADEDAGGESSLRRLTAPLCTGRGSEGQNRRERAPGIEDVLARAGRGQRSLWGRCANGRRDGGRLARRRVANTGDGSALVRRMGLERSAQTLLVRAYAGGITTGNDIEVSRTAHDWPACAAWIPSCYGLGE